jgi:hypothetical protein
MASFDLDRIREINQLWDPVYPYLAKQIYEFYGRRDGSILEIGPFCGVIFSLQKLDIGSSFAVAAFPAGMGPIFRYEAKRLGLEDKIEVVETDSSLQGIDDHGIDLAVFRGAFFFPSLFRVDLLGIHRVLKPNGVAFIGGGFGKYTPDAVIKEIGKRSRDLNLRIGKVEVNPEQLRKDIDAHHLKAKVEVTSEGGLWVVMRK